MSAPGEKFIEWVDALPSTWGAKRLGILASVKARLGWKGLKAEEYVDEGYIFLATPNLKGDEIDFENVNYITKARYEESPEIMLREGDVLMVKDGATLGIVALVKSLPAPATVNGSTAVIRCKNECDCRFLYHWLRSQGVQQLIEKMKGGMGVPHLFQSDLRRFPVALPHLPEQHSIAIYLDEQTAKIDRLMDMRRRQMALLKEQRAALIQQAVTRGLNPNAPMKDSGLPWLGEIPAHWEILPLKRELKFVTSGSRGWAGHYSDTGKLFLRIGNLTRDSIDLDLSDVQLVDVPTGTEGERTRVQKGDLLISITADLGSVAVVPESIEEAYVSQHVALARPTKKSSLPCWLGYLLLSRVGKVQLEMAGLGGTKIQLALDDIKSLLAFIPPFDEQTAILRFIEEQQAKFDALHTTYSRQLTLLTEYRAALIHECVTGQRTVIRQTAVESRPTKANVHFLRAVLCSEIIHRLHQEPTFGRVKLEKFLYLSEAYAGIDLEGRYQRAAAGPFDNQALRSVESQIQKQKWYQPVKGEKGTRYVPMEKAGGHQKYFSRYWSEQKPKFDRLFSLLHSFTTERCEIVATLFAVWNDRLQAGQPCTDADIVDEVLTQWHPSKERILRERWLNALQWMKQEGLTP